MRLGNIARVIAVLVAAGALVALLPGRAAAARHGASSSLVSLQAGVLVQLNQIRAAHGLAPLTSNPGLAEAAARHAGDMLALGYFTHDSGDGTAFSRWVLRYYGSAGYGYWSAGENLLWSPESLDAKHALELWMASPEHRANVLRPRWREIGIAAVHEVGAPGAFGGNAVTLLAADFGVRR